MGQHSTFALTGATGAIGSRFLTKAVRRGHQVRAFSRTPLLPPQSGVEWYQFDLSKAEQLDTNALRGADTVVHLAAHIPHDHNDPEEALFCWQANVLGTHRLVEAMADAGVKHLIQTSSANIYAPWLANPDEASLVHPQTRTFYLSSKAAQEWCAESACRQHGIDLVTLRLSSVFGTGSGTVDNIARKLLNGETVQLSNGGQFGADFISCDDVLSALFLMLDKDCTGTLNVASGKRSTIREVTEILAELCNRTQDAIRLLASKGQPDLGFPAINIAKLTALGFRATNLRAGLASLVESLATYKADKDNI